MIFWVDAQLPPALAGYLSRTFNVQSQPVRDLGLRDAPDETIYLQARQPGMVVITKDQDFLEMSLRHGPPPQIVWLTCGNCSNSRLREIFDHVFTDVLRLLESGEAVVEISGER